MDSSSPHLLELASLVPDEASRSFLIVLIDALPNIVAILNKDRELVYTNQTTLDKISIPNFEMAFHMKPGELFKCVNADIGPDGCGTSAACKLCGALSALVLSANTGSKVTQNCQIQSKSDGLNNSYHFRFTSSPFINKDLIYYVITIEDKSEEHRKIEMERIFYHDILNSLSGLGGVISILKEKGQEEAVHMKILENSYRNLSRTINEQREISQAERGELIVNKRLINSISLINDVIQPFLENHAYIGNLVVSDTCIDRNFVSDPILFSRVLRNMVKNALEATGANEDVTIGVDQNNQHLTFWVNNPAIIPKNIQLRIFERLFTTKGPGRGLGSFSMKLLGENYLGGEISFTSIKDRGTTFSFSIPT